MMSRILSISAVTSTLGLLAACSQTASTDVGVGPGGLTEYTWIAETYAGQPVNSTAPAVITIDDDGALRAVAGCSAFSGHADVKGSKVRFGQITMTAVCAGKDESGQTELVSVLNTADRWYVQEDYLLLYAAGSILASRFERRDAPQAMTAYLPTPENNSAAP